VRCELDSADNPKGIVVSDREMDGLNIGLDAFHGEWNYTMQPTSPSVRALVSGLALTSDRYWSQDGSQWPLAA